MQNLKVEKSVQEYNPRYKANLYLNSILSSIFIHRYFITHTYIYIHQILLYSRSFKDILRIYKNKKIIEIMYLYVVLSLEIFETSLNLCAFTHVHVGRRVAFLNLSTMIGGHRRPIIRDLGRDGRL